MLYLLLYKYNKRVIKTAKNRLHMENKNYNSSCPQDSWHQTMNIHIPALLALPFCIFLISTILVR
jgi:hypothetical protein